MSTTCDSFIVTLPVQLISESNVTWREPYGVKTRRKKQQRETVTWGLSLELRRRPWPCPPLCITLTRCAYGLFDDDNLRPAFKAVRDAVTSCLGFKHDKPPCLVFKYEQRLLQRLRGTDLRLRQFAPEVIDIEIKEIQWDE